MYIFKSPYYSNLFDESNSIIKCKECLKNPDTFENN